MMGMSIDRLIYDLVIGLHGGKSSEQACNPSTAELYPKFSQPTKALYLAFDIRASYHRGKKEGSASCSLHYLFNRPFGSEGFATTHTFAAVHENPFAKLKDITHWEFLSSHDSCWRDAARDKAWAVERELYEMTTYRAKVRDNEKVPYNRLNWMVSFGGDWSTFYKWVSVIISKDQTDQHNYKKTIEVLTAKD